MSGDGNNPGAHSDDAVGGGGGAFEDSTLVPPGKALPPIIPIFEDQTMVPRGPAKAPAMPAFEDATMVPRGPAKPPAMPAFEDATMVPRGPAKPAASGFEDATMVPRGPAKPPAMPGFEDATMVPRGSASATAPVPASFEDRTLLPISRTPTGITGMQASSASSGRIGTAAPRTSAGGRRPSDRLPVTGAPAADWHLAGRAGPLTGQQLGDFAVGGILGEGGMGVVYRARQLSLNRRAALKVLAAAMAEDETLLQRFHAESHAAGLIQSPHVVQAYFAGVVDGTVFYAMEFVEGTDLHKLAGARRTANEPITPVEAGRWLLQAAKGLAAAAAHGIVHRDIKPQNLLVTPDGTLKIADFGVAKVLGEQALTLTGGAVGTPAYASPEQGRGGTVDCRSDLYSLGVVLYELLTGRKPFDGTTADALIYQHNYAEPIPPCKVVESIPADYEAVCMRCLMKDPEQRYQEAEALAADLELLLAGTAPTVEPYRTAHGTGAAAAMDRHLPRRRRVLPLVVAAAALSLSVGGYWYWSNAAERRGAERSEITRRRANAASLDLAATPYAGAGADLDWLRGRVGAKDPDVRRWAAKLERVAGLAAALRWLDEREPTTAAERLAARRDLDAWLAEVGSDDAASLRWSQRLAVVDARLAAARGDLRVLDGEAPVPFVMTVRLTPVLDGLETLAGSEDADVVRWRAALARQARVAGDLRQRLAALAQPEVELDGVRAAALSSDLATYTAMAGPDDADVALWSRPLTAFAAVVDRLRGNLGRLDRVEVATVPLLAELATDFERYRTLAAREDRQLVLWEAKAAATTQRLATLREGLGALLDPPEALAVDRLLAADRLLGDYRALVSADDGRLLAWERRLTREHQDLDELRKALVRLDAPAALTSVEAGACRTALVALAGLGALGPEQRAAAIGRLDREQAELDHLRRELAALDAAGQIGSDRAGVHLVALRSVAGDQDDQVRTASARRNAHADLRQRLAVLDQIAPPPDDTTAALTGYAALVPGDDADLARWRAKAARVSELRAALADLDRPAPLPAGADAAVGELAERWVGEDDPGVRRGRAKLADLARLRAALGPLLDGIPALPPDSPAPALLADLQALVGPTDAEAARLAQQFIRLDGPPRPAWATAWGRDRHGRWAEAKAAGIAFRLRYVPGGDFVLGSPAGEAGRDADEAAVRITLSSGCWLAEAECSQALWRAVTGRDPSQMAGAERPVECVSWDDAQGFLAALSRAVPGLEPRLPTEAEWERACRAGGGGAYHGPDGPWGAARLAELGWFAQRDGTREVKRLQPNALGLHDLHGNVWEWCVDRAGAYPTSPTTDPVGTRDQRRIARGGSFADQAEALRAANRLALDPHARSRMVGLRLAAPTGWPPPAAAAP